MFAWKSAKIDLNFFTNFKSSLKKFKSAREAQDEPNPLIMDLRSPRNKRWIRLIAWVIIIAFLNQDIVRAQGGEPILLKSAAPSDKTLRYNYNKQAPIDNLQGVSIPQNIAVTKESYDSGGGDIIINIQDAHASLGAQESIAKVLDTLVSDYDLSLVAIEGSKGYINTNILRTFPHEKIKEKIAQNLMEEGRISAGEFFSITSKEDISLYGIEDYSLYKENVEQFKAVHL
ncbi:hypothetical protein ACFL3N_02850, partial [Candidatus Omnitrophota bacterium]